MNKVTVHPYHQWCFMLSLFETAKRMKFWKVYIYYNVAANCRIFNHNEKCHYFFVCSRVDTWGCQTVHHTQWKCGVPIKHSSRKLQKYMLHVILRLNIDPHGYTADGLHNESFYQQQDLIPPEGKGQQWT